MPTLNEIGKNFDFSRERARQKMEQLEEEGYVIKVSRRHRKSYAFTPGGVIKLWKKNF